MSMGALICRDPASLGVEPWQFVTVVLFDCGCPRAWGVVPEMLPAEGERVTTPAGQVLTAFAETARCHLVAGSGGGFALMPWCRRHGAGG